MLLHLVRFKNWLLGESTKHKLSCVMHVLRHEPVKSAIRNWAVDHLPDDVLDPDKGREDELHVTVLYGLHTNDPDDVAKVIESFKPFQIRFGAISKFAAEKYDVIKIEVSGDKLEEMNEALKKLPYTSDFPKYQGHCTLAYVKPGSCDHLLPNDAFKDMIVDVADVVFSPADGPKKRIGLNGVE